MELIRGLHNLRSRHHGCVATIGNFDGVHLGHQAVIGQLAEKAERLNLPILVILFEPQPLEFFQPDKVPPRLNRFREKIESLRRYSVDRVLVIRFDASFSNMTAEQFIQDVLVAGIGVRYLVIGDDFHFGKKRLGNFAILQQAGQQHGFEVVNVHTFNIEDARVSSTRVRDALKVGDLAAAEKLLGRPYRMSGRVAHGNKLGRQLGIPTANIHLHRQLSPLMGVYVVEMFGLKGEPLAGVADVGNRPTVGGGRTLLEVHLLDFNADIYGQHVSTQFLHKIRDEEKYESIEILKQKIEQDISTARSWFKQRDAASSPTV